MERNLKEIIEELCKELGAKDEQIKQKKDELDINLYKKLKHVNYLDKEFWKD